MSCAPPGASASERSSCLLEQRHRHRLTSLRASEAPRRGTGAGRDLGVGGRRAPRPPDPKPANAAFELGPVRGASASISRLQSPRPREWAHRVEPPRGGTTPRFDTSPSRDAGGDTAVTGRDPDRAACRSRVLRYETAAPRAAARSSRRRLDPETRVVRRSEVLARRQRAKANSWVFSLPTQLLRARRRATSLRHASRRCRGGSRRQPSSVLPQRRSRLDRHRSLAEGRRRGLRFLERSRPARR